MIRRLSPKKLVLFSLLVIVAVFALNILAMYLERNLALFLDFSYEKVYSVSEATKEICKELEDEVIIYYYTGTGKTNKGITALLESYNAKCKNVSVINLQTGQSDGFIQRFDLGTGVNEGSIVVTSKGFNRFRVINTASFYTLDAYGNQEYVAEQRITSAIKYVVTGRTKRIRFLTSHRETDMSNLSKLTGLLSSKDYQYNVYDAMIEGDELDPENDILVIVSPKTDLAHIEAEKIHNYLNSGGSAVVFLDKTDETMTEFSRILNMRNLSYENRIVYGCDPKYTNMSPYSLIVRSRNTAFRMIEDKSIVVKNLIPIELNGTGENTEVLLETFPACKIEGKSSTELNTFTVAACSEEGSSKLILIGSSSIIENGELGISGNLDFISRMLSFVSDTDISIEPKHLSYETDNAPIPYTQKVLIAFFIIVIIPATAFIIGVISRKHL
ncbi:MAG: GldG family protein [Clostridia bacterium]|nr:GldG family protein [Clostridia bacterium]